MQELDVQWDKLLKIKTTGRDDSNSTQLKYPYEPTPYSVLERLANSDLIRKWNTLLDYGCGKGRVDFFLSYQTRCKSIGIEYDSRIYNAAIINKNSSVSGKRVEIRKENAELYDIPSSVDRCYFFNPFSIEILKLVVDKIIESYNKHPREILLFFYYPSKEYISFLDNLEILSRNGEINCSDLFNTYDNREKILIYKLCNK